MKDFERNYFGSGPRPSTMAIERKRDVLLRTNSDHSNRETIDEWQQDKDSSSIGLLSSIAKETGVVVGDRRTSSLRRHPSCTISFASTGGGTVKKEVNFVSPTRSDTEQPRKSLKHATMLDEFSGRPLVLRPNQSVESAKTYSTKGESAVDEGVYHKQQLRPLRNCETEDYYGDEVLDRLTSHNQRQMSNDIVTIGDGNTSHEQGTSIPSDKPQEINHSAKRDLSRTVSGTVVASGGLKNNEIDEYCTDATLESSRNFSDWITPTGGDTISYYSDSTVSNYPTKPIGSSDNTPVPDCRAARVHSSSWSLSSNCANLDRFSKATIHDDSRFGTIRSVQSECRTSSTSRLNRSGSLKRITGGRCNSSLCSCDAGAEVVLQADGKPLIEYSLEGGRKQHTYTCEQNAKILLRLERQRQLKKVMVASTGKVNILRTSESKGKGLGELDYHRLLCRAKLARRRRGDCSWSDIGDDTDLDDIPPPPGPPLLRKNLSLTNFPELQDSHPLFPFIAPTLDQYHKPCPDNQYKSLYQHPHYSEPLLHLAISNLSSSPSVSFAAFSSLQSPDQFENQRQSYSCMNGQQRRLPLTNCYPKGNADVASTNEQDECSSSSSGRSFFTQGPSHQSTLERAQNHHRRTLIARSDQLKHNKLLQLHKTEPNSLKVGFISRECNNRSNKEQNCEISKENALSVCPMAPHIHQQSPDICNITARTEINGDPVLCVGGNRLSGHPGYVCNKDEDSEGLNGAKYKQMWTSMMMKSSELRRLESSNCEMNDGLSLHHHHHTQEEQPHSQDIFCSLPEQPLDHHHQTAIIGDNGGTLTRPKCFVNASQFDNFPKCSLLDKAKCAFGSGGVGMGTKCSAPMSAGLGAKLNGGRGDYNELNNKCVNLKMGGGGGAGSSDGQIPNILHCRGFENCNYGYGPDIGDLLLLENDLVHGTNIFSGCGDTRAASTAALLMKQRHSYAGRAGGCGSCPVTPTLSMNSNGMMPWRHRQCSSSRGSNSSVSSSTRWDFPSKHWLALTSILLIAGAAGVAVPFALRVTAGAPFEDRLEAATQLLDAVPLIDGHNDLPWNIRKFLHNQLNDFPFDTDLRNVNPWAKSTWSHTDLTRLRKGRVSAQFWAAYVPCEAQHRDAVQLTLEQIDVISRLTERYSPQLTSCTSVAEIEDAHTNQQICSLTGVEGGHSLGGSLGVLRTFYSVGVRYMTLTSTCHTPWADSSFADAPRFDVKHGGLTAFGKKIIREMNRLGMIVDLSHTSVGTMRDTLAVSEAPVIFSHSSAYELCNTSRNVQNDILEAIAKNRGLVMVNFYSMFLSCSENATVHDAVAHINHIKRVAGIDHVGLGAGFDGINYTPKGLEDVSTYPTLFAELLGDGWTMEDLTKLAGKNFLRVLADVEALRDKMKQLGIKPSEDIPNFRSEDPYNCTSS